jgi:hypothetical protein
MPRILVYVNETHSEATIHKEENSPCRHIFQQFIAGNAEMKPIIEVISDEHNKNVIKIGESRAGNSFWLLIWIEHLCSADINKQIETILKKDIEKELRILNCMVCSK